MTTSRKSHKNFLRGIFFDKILLSAVRRPKLWSLLSRVRSDVLIFIFFCWFAIYSLSRNRVRFPLLKCEKVSRKASAVCGLLILLHALVGRATESRWIVSGSRRNWWASFMLMIKYFHCGKVTLYVIFKLC